MDNRKGELASKDRSTGKKQKVTMLGVEFWSSINEIAYWACAALNEQSDSNLPT